MDAAKAGSEGGSDSRSLENDPPQHTPLASQSVGPVRRSSGLSCGRLATSWLRAARGELLQQHGEFSLDFDHPPCFRQVRLQACILAAQSGQLVLALVSRRPTRRNTQRMECSLLPLPAPLGDRRRVQPLPTQESASAVTIAAFVFFEEPQL